MGFPSNLRILARSVGRAGFFPAFALQSLIMHGAKPMRYSLFAKIFLRENV